MIFETLLSDARSIVTLLSFLSFLGIVFWAYSKRRKAAFEEAANLPFADEPNSRRENNHG